MKSKSTNMWEQYIEYIALVVAIAILGWFAWGAFGTKIEYRQGKITVQTNNVDDELLRVATSLESKLRDGSSAPISIEAPEALLDKFSSEMNESVSPRDRVVFPDIDMTAELDANQDVQSELREYVSPVVPEPKNVRTRQWFGTIADNTMNDTSELREVIEGPPHDTMWIQIAGTVDIEAIAESYSADGELSAIPSQWYDSAIDIFDVTIERQQLTLQGWSDPEVISILPGHLSYRDQLSEKNIDAIERNDIISNLRKGKQSEIVTPDFYPLKGFTPKELKDPSVWSGDIQMELTPLQLLQEELAEAEEDIRSHEEEIEKIKADIVSAGASGGGGVGGGGRGGGSPSSGNDRKLERLRRNLQRAKEELVGLVEARDKIQTAINELREASDIDEGESILSGEVWIWGHDMDVTAGSTYRYRLQLHVANPFFGHKPSLYSQQHALADNVVIPSVESDWSAPVEVQRSEQWFVKKAKSVPGFDTNDLQNHGYVSVEVFEFSDGQWTKKTRDVKVGQPIAVGNNPDGLGWFVLDVIEDVNGEVALLQDIMSGELIAKRPSDELASVQLMQLLRTVREQSSEETSDNSSDDTGGAGNPPEGPPGGGRGGGIGGGGRGGGIGGGGRGGGGRGGGGRE